MTTPAVTVWSDDLSALLSHTAPDPGPPHVSEAWHRLKAANDAALAGQASRLPRAEGQWMEMTFFGYADATGYVTEITVGGEACFHIDLPGKLFGGDPRAWVEYSARAMRSRRPADAESERAEWEEDVRLAAEERQRREAWERQQQTRALTAGAADDTRTLEPADTFAGAPADGLPF